MKQQFNTIGVIGRLGSAQVVDTLKRLIRFLDSRGLAMVIEERTATRYAAAGPRSAGGQPPSDGRAV
mgnify:CR=1 FL=1